MSEVKGLGRGLSDLGVSALLSNLDQNAAKKNVQDIHVSQLDTRSISAKTNLQ